MIVAGLAAGAGVGLGLVLVARGLLAGPPPLGQALAALHAPPETGDGTLGRARTGVARGIRDLLGAAGADLRSLDADLRVLGRSFERHAVEKLAAAVVGLMLPVAMGLALQVAGVAPRLPLVLLGGAAMSVAGFVLPDILVRGQAAERRRSFRYALSSYLDLVRVILAAGAGVETALSDAAEAGQGWAFVRLRSALARARLAGESPWEAFARLGDELQVSELREVASSLGLAGTHGAKIRASLEARSRAMRARDLADMEAQAEGATERMSLPSVLLVVGFIVFVGFPAAWEILGF